MRALQWANSNNPVWYGIERKLCDPRLEVSSARALVVTVNMKRRMMVVTDAPNPHGIQRVSLTVST